MSQIVQEESPILAGITDQTNYLNARDQADQLAQETSLPVGDMPLVIQAMDLHPRVRQAIRLSWVDTITAEAHGLRDGERSYEAWHSAGSLATADGLKKAASTVGAYGFMTIHGDEWTAVGNGAYNGKEIVRVHLDDARKGNVPVSGTAYTVFVRLDKDNPTINPAGQLSYDAFMKDDRVLMVAGSPQGREALAKMLFGKKEDGGEGWNSVGSYNRINDVDFSELTKGRLALLDYGYGGLIGGGTALNRGRFAVVAAGGGRSAQKNEVSTQVLVAPTLEEITAIIKQP